MTIILEHEIKQTAGNEISHLFKKKIIVYVMVVPQCRRTGPSKSGPSEARQDSLIELYVKTLKVFENCKGKIIWK